MKNRSLCGNERADLLWLINRFTKEGLRTMRTHVRVAVLAAFAAAFSITWPAQASFIAGWDFSQYAGAASLVVDLPNDESSDTLKSNYSDFDQTFGAGGASQPFGTMYMNGANGSTNVDELAPLPIFRPLAGSLTSNATLPGSNEVPVGDVNFGTSDGVLQVGDGNYLAGTGQDFNIALSMIASSNVSVVFEANLSVLGGLYSAENWSLSFGGRTNNGTSDVTLEFSTDGVVWTPLTTAGLTSVDTLFTRSVVGNPGDNAFFRFGLIGGTTTNQPRIDNVSISGDVTVIPEPGTAMLLLFGLTGLGMAGRRRS
jgi:hypothetical protein